jgi:cytochrome c553
VSLRGQRSRSTAAAPSEALDFQGLAQLGTLSAHTKAVRFISVTTVLAWLSVAATPKGIEAPATGWNGPSARNAALRLKGDPQRGKEGYSVCAACHLWSGSGRNDGLFPQLAGQHSSVIIKQLADIRSGIRDNDLMYPFATTLTDPQEIADIAAFIRTLRPEGLNGKGPGQQLAEGQRLFERDCAGCHGLRGEGNAQAFIPVVASQHYKYLLRQLIDIQEGTRRNANPVMAKLLQKYSRPELSNLADWASRLEPLEAAPTKQP